MKDLLIAKATKEKVVIYSDLGKEEHKFNVQVWNNNVYHVDKRCPPISFYLMNNKYCFFKSDERKHKIKRVRLLKVKSNAINNFETRIDINQGKNKLKWNR